MRARPAVPAARSCAASAEQLPAPGPAACAACAVLCPGRPAWFRPGGGGRDSGPGAPMLTGRCRTVPEGVVSRNALASGGHFVQGLVGRSFDRCAEGPLWAQLSSPQDPPPPASAVCGGLWRGQAGQVLGGRRKSRPALFMRGRPLLASTFGGEGSLGTATWTCHRHPGDRQGPEKQSHSHF